MAIIDTTPPAIVSIYPANRASNVSTGISIRPSFNQSTKAGSGGIIISNGQGDTRRIAIHDGSQVSFGTEQVTCNYNGKTTCPIPVLTITPHEHLLSNSYYYVQVDAGAIISDTSDSRKPLVTNDTAYGFTTSADIIAPIPLSAKYTLDSEKGVSTITATFNETVTKSYRTSYPTVVVSDRQGDTRRMDISAYGNEYVKLSAINLRPNTTYFLTMPPGVIYDLAGN